MRRQGTRDEDGDSTAPRLGSVTPLQSGTEICASCDHNLAMHPGRNACNECSCVWFQSIRSSAVHGPGNKPGSDLPVSHFWRPDRGPAVKHAYHPKPPPWPETIRSPGHVAVSSGAGGRRVFVPWRTRAKEFVRKAFEPVRSASRAFAVGGRGAPRALGRSCRVCGKTMTHSQSLRFSDSHRDWIHSACLLS